MEGQCHFLEGNTNAVKRIAKVKEMLDMLGIDPGRLEFFHLSAAQGPRWAEICTEFTEKINALGPSHPLSGLHFRKSWSLRTITNRLPEPYLPEELLRKEWRDYDCRRTETIR